MPSRPSPCSRSAPTLPGVRPGMSTTSRWPGVIKARMPLRK